MTTMEQTRLWQGKVLQLSDDEIRVHSRKKNLVRLGSYKIFILTTNLKHSNHQIGIFGIFHIFCCIKLTYFIRIFKGLNSKFAWNLTDIYF